MLLPIEIDAISQKRGCKRDLIRFSGSAGGKIVFALLTEVITFYVKPTAVDVRGLDLEFVPKSTFWCLEERLVEVIYIFLNLPGNVKSQESRK